MMNNWMMNNWEAGLLKDPEFRKIAERLEVEYQAERLRIIEKINHQAKLQVLAGMSGEHRRMLLKL